MVPDTQQREEAADTLGVEFTSRVGVGDESGETFGSAGGCTVSDSSVNGTGETVLSVHLPPGSVASTLR